jgi:Ser/Thr protein kinase RdoA (MazF antagonist)
VNIEQSRSIEPTEQHIDNLALKSSIIMDGNAIINTDIELLLTHYNYDFSQATITYLGHGHINITFKVCTPERDFVLQKINHEIFTKPLQLCNNAQQINEHLLEQKNKAKYPLMVPQHILSRDGQNVVKIAENYWRLMDFVEDSYTLEKVSSSIQAAQVAKAFALFSGALSDFSAEKLAVIIADFHDISFRIRQLSDAVANDNENRLSDCQEVVDFCLSQQHFIEQVVEISSRLPLHVTHNDTKINNLLFSNTDHKPCAVIDLDTCMPGLLMHDFGDMVRTCCSNLAEDDAGTEEMVFNIDIFEALITNYVRAFGSKISLLERQSLIVGTKLLPFIIGTRFLTDHLNGDKYFHVSRADQNLDRAKNQLQLYKLAVAIEPELATFIQQ